MEPTPVLWLLLVLPASVGGTLAAVRSSRARHIALSAWIALPIATATIAVGLAFAPSHDAFGWTVNVLALLSPLFLGWGVLSVGGYMVAKRLMR